MKLSHLSEKWKQKLREYGPALLILLVGILMMLPGGGGEKEQPERSAEGSSFQEFDLEEFEERLSKTLSQVEGAGETMVMLSVKSGSRRVLAQNMERDGEEMVSTTVTLGKGSGTQEVVALQTFGPQFQGAVVVCPGGEDPQVRLRLSASVSALTGLGSDRISICKRT